MLYFATGGISEKGWRLLFAVLGQEAYDMRVWVNGSFDVIHRGHIELFRYAKSLGDELIVGTDSDENISKHKGDNRPINTLNDRIFMLQSVKYIDKVYPFYDDSSLMALIKWCQPDVMVIGSDWRGKNVIGEEYVGKLIYFDRIEGYSSTDIINADSHRT